MKFLIDEDVPIEVSGCLRQAGHEISFVTDTLGQGTTDLAIWQSAVRSGAVVITCNRDDFLQLAGTTPKTGLIIVNRRRTRQAECGHILRLVTRAGEEGLEGNVNFA